MCTDDHDPKKPLLTVRNTLVFLLAVLHAAAAGAFTALAGHSGFEAGLVSLGALPIAIRFFHWLIN